MAKKRARHQDLDCGLESLHLTIQQQKKDLFLWRCQTKWLNHGANLRWKNILVVKELFCEGTS